MANGVDALIRLTVSFTYHGVTCQNLFWLRTKETSPAGTFKVETDKAVEEWRVYIWPKYQAFCVGELRHVQSVATMVQPLNSAQTIEAPSAAFASVVGEGLPSTNAAVLSLYTPYPGRRVHGRLYIPAVPESQSASSVLLSAHLSKLKDIGDALIAKWGEVGTSPYFWMGIFSRKNGAVRQPGPPPFISYSPLSCVPITRVVANEVIGTQRHRKKGRGI